MRWVFSIALFLCCSVAFAAQTYRFDRGVVTVGDSVASLVQRGGKPDRVVPLENKFGAVDGEWWEYYLPGGKMVTFFIDTDSKIYAIDESN
jgi:hypothetical protein